MNFRNETQPTEQENLETFVEVEGFGIAPMLRRQRSMPPKYDDVFPNSFDENNDPTPTAPPIEFNLNRLSVI